MAYDDDDPSDETDEDAYAPDPASDHDAWQAAIDAQVQQWADPATPPPGIAPEPDPGDGSHPFDALLTKAVGARTRLSDVVMAPGGLAPNDSSSGRADAETDGDLSVHLGKPYDLGADASGLAYNTIWPFGSPRSTPDTFLNSFPVPKAPVDRPALPPGAIPPKDSSRLNYWQEAYGMMPSLGQIESATGQSNGHGQVSMSPKGAVGQYQLMPGTAKEMAQKLGLPWDERQFRDPGPNGGLYNFNLSLPYVESLLEKYGGDNYLAAAAYNGGPANVDKWLGKYGDPRTGIITEWDFANRIPFPETKKYVLKTQFK